MTTNPLILKETLKKELARRSLIQFLPLNTGDSWVPGKHLDYLCEKLEAVERGEIKRLIVCMPPRHGKSQTISRAFPAWYLGRHPDHEIIVSSYSADLAYDLSRAARASLREWGSELWNLELDKESAAVGRWGLEGHKGGLMAAGVGGPITGRGAHIAIIDDPLKSWAEAASQTIRDSTWDWYGSTLRTRLAPGGAIVLVLTRWHVDDLAGRLLAEAANGGEQWEVISFPGIAEENDILGRAPGEALWPQRYPIQELESYRKGRELLFAALYQQRPVPAGGNMVRNDWLRRYSCTPEHFDQIVQSWDLASSEKTSADYSVGLVLGRKGADIYLLDMVRGQWAFPEQIRQIKNLSTRYPYALTKLVENTSNGRPLVQSLRSQIQGLIPVDVSRDKVTRLNAVLPIIEAGNLLLPENAPWLNDFTVELTSFPSAPHDDCVDALTQGLQRLSNGSAPLQITSYL